MNREQKLLRWVAALLLSGLLCGASSARAVTDAPKTNPIDAVDPFIGTMGDGDVYPGATLPFGFIQNSPDTGPRSGSAGYSFDKNINGFSQQHISGMGGPLFGEISLLPITGALEKPSQVTSTGKTAEAASPGYYTVTLAPWNTKAELSATRHVALHRYTFPASQQSRILVNVGHCLFGTSAGWGSAKPGSGQVTVNAAAQEVSGFMTYQGGRGWSRRNWKVYFVARFDTPFQSFGTWDDAGTLVEASAQRTGAEIGAYLNFQTKAGQVVHSKVGISWRSVEQARGYFAKEAPGWDFDGARQKARAEWSEALGKIQVEGGTPEQRRQFYTALYRIHVTPNDWTGESPERYGDQTYYENMLCLWDTFRTVNPMLTLIQPRVQAGIVNSLIGYQQKDGWTGDAHSAHAYEHVQNGSSADNIIADAYVKQLPGIDWKAAYTAIRKNAFVDANPNANGRPSSGRFRLDDYRKYGYVPTDVATNKDIQGVSRTLEYVYNDFCVLQLAKKYGTPEDVADLQSRPLWYQKLWDESSGGFMRGKTKAGAWQTPFDPLKTETGPQYYEGHAWTWSWFVPHDTQGLINLMGGVDPFVDKLTIACDKYYQAFNEPCMLETFLFIHAGRPDKTQFYVRKALSNFSARHDGLPGNDDSGTTSAWLLWAMLGIYPNSGQDLYYIGSPTFSKATIKLDGGKQLVINAAGASDSAKYVTGGTLNGKPWNQAWLRHSDLINGATLDLQMSGTASKWGAKNLPPSISKNRQ